MSEIGGIPSEAHPAAEDMGVVSKLINIFFAPSKTLEAVARKPKWQWVLPVVLCALASLFYQQVSIPRFDKEAALDQVMSKLEKRNPQMTDQQKEQTEEMVRKQFSWGEHPAARAVGVLLPLIHVFFVGLLYWAAAAMFKMRTTYMKVVACFSWALIPSAIYWFLTALVILPREKIYMAETQNMLLLKSNPAAFMNAETGSMALLTLLSYIDVFVLWGLFLKIIGLKKSAGFSTGAAAGVAVTLFVVWVLIRVGLAAISSAFGG